MERDGDCGVLLVSVEGAHSGCKRSHAASASCPSPQPEWAGSLQLIIVCLHMSGCKWLLQQSPSSPCPWVLEHSPHHLPQGNAFKTLAERKEIWGKCSQPPAATKQMWLSSSRHLTHPSEHLFIYLLCGQGEVAAKPLQEFPQWERF